MSVCVCEGEYATQPQTAQRYSLLWWLLIHMFVLRAVFPSLNWVSPARSTSASEWELSPGEVKCEGVNFSAFCLSICTSSLRQPRCFQMSPRYCSINMISLPAPHLFLCMLSESIAASPCPCDPDSLLCFYVYVKKGRLKLYRFCENDKLYPHTSEMFSFSAQSACDWLKMGSASL